MLNELNVIFFQYNRDGLLMEILHLMGKAGARKLEKFLKNLEDLLFNSLFKGNISSSLLIIILNRISGNITNEPINYNLRSSSNPISV